MEKPAGFWIRAAASIIDVFIIAIFSFIMIFINTLIVLPLIDAAGTHMSEEFAGQRLSIKINILIDQKKQAAELTSPACFTISQKPSALH
ncbi:hypothetical protein [Bacillus subtilis]|uniref:hypothetical protein n=1 Tax=Bacillus subtilis TaxID=1423 RepID=UPI0020B42DEB|nr:hypothetical protein [Bacillus subtilis]